jgi:hypothetical protein
MVRVPYVRKDLEKAIVVEEEEPLKLNIRCPKCEGREWGSAAQEDGSRLRHCHNPHCRHIWKPGDGDSWVLYYEQLKPAREHIIKQFLRFTQSRGLSLTAQERQAMYKAEGLIEQFVEQDETDYSVPEGTSRESVGTEYPKENGSERTPDRDGSD